MNRTDARKIAETITNEQLQEMFNNAKEKITDWTKVSDVNKGITKGVGWNILAKDFDVKHDYHILAKTNMVWEFGDFLPDELKLKKQSRQSPFQSPTHHDPIFNI